MADRHVAGHRLSAFLDDELDDQDALAAARHLAGCTRCFAELEALRTTREAVRRLPSLQAPVLVTSGALAGGHPRRGRRVRPLAVVAMLPLVAALVLTLVNGLDGRVERSPDMFLVEQPARDGAPNAPSAIDDGR